MINFDTEKFQARYGTPDVDGVDDWEFRLDSGHSLNEWHLTREGKWVRSSATVRMGYFALVATPIPKKVKVKAWLTRSPFGRKVLSFKAPVRVGEGGWYWHLTESDEGWPKGLPDITSTECVAVEVEVHAVAPDLEQDDG